MFEGDDSVFPNKPEVVANDKKSNWVKTIVSMLLFVAVFFFLFNENYALILMVTAVLLVHELGHFVMMKKYGYKSVNMLFIPLFGAMVSGDKGEVSQSQKFWISIMGPLPGIILGIAGLMYCVNSGEIGMLFELSLLLIAINLLNLVPLDPLDGGHILETLLFPTNPQAKLYFTLLSSLFLIGVGFYSELYIIMIFGFFMSLKVRGFQKSQRIHNNLDEIEFNYKKSYQDLTNKEYWTIRRVFLENNPKIKEIIPDDLVLWENEKLIVDQIQQILKIDVKDDLSLVKKVLYFILFLTAIALPSMLLIHHHELILDTFWSKS